MGSWHGGGETSGQQNIIRRDITYSRQSTQTDCDATGLAPPSVAVLKKAAALTYIRLEVKNTNLRKYMHELERQTSI
jgi:hypothetical protein